MSEVIIAMFDKENPCWTGELLQFVGEDIEFLPEMVKNGTLKFSAGIYSLTEAGIREFCRVKEELFLDTEPGIRSADPVKSVARTKLRLLLDNAHIQRWGIKDFHSNISLPIRPKLSRDEIFLIKGGELLWNYSESKTWKNIESEFPKALIEGRRTDLVQPEELVQWCEKYCPEAGSLDVDLLYLCRYDFMQYSDFPGHPNDPMKIINTDRFLFVFPDPSMECNLETIGKFHIWLNGLRRMLIPGYVDRDTQEQDSVSWLLFTVEKEEEAVSLARKLSVFGEKLVEDANPCEVWTLSLESLENLDKKRELIWELLPEVAHPVQRTII